MLLCSRITCHIQSFYLLAYTLKIKILVDYMIKILLSTFEPHSIKGRFSAVFFDILQMTGCQPFSIVQMWHNIHDFLCVTFQPICSIVWRYKQICCVFVVPCLMLVKFEVYRVQRCYLSVMYKSILFMVINLYFILYISETK